MDKTGITTVQAIPKFISENGLLTVACIVTAAGDAIALAMIFLMVHFKDYMIIVTCSSHRTQLQWASSSQSLEHGAMAR